MCLAKSRGSTPEQRYLWRAGVYDAIRDVVARQLECRANMPVRTSEPRGILPIFSDPSTDRGEHDGTLCHSGDCLGASAALWLSAGHSGAPSTRDARESQTGRTNDAGDNLLTNRHRELLRVAEPSGDLEIYLNLASRLKVGRGVKPAVDCGYHPHSAQDRVCLLGSGPGCLFSESCGLVPRPNVAV